MAETPQFKSIRRRFTPEERRRFEEGKRWAEENKPRLTREALAHKAQLDASYAAMQLLKREREARGLTLTEVAERAGIDKSNLSKLENDINANPTLETLFRVARAIGVKLTIGVQDAA